MQNAQPRLTNSQVAPVRQTNSERSTVRPLSSDSIETLFAEFEPLYGARLADMWRGSDISRVKQVWREALSGFRVGEVKAGLLACRAKPYPPTLPDFLLMCRPPADVEELFVVAQEQLSRRAFGEDVWPCKAVYWAAVDYGFFQLRTHAWQTAKPRWTRILIEKMRIEDDLPKIPAPLPALPAPGTAFTDVDVARKNLSELKALSKAGEQAVQEKRESFKASLSLF